MHPWSRISGAVYSFAPWNKHFSGAFELRIQILATLSQGRACYPSICEEL